MLKKYIRCLSRIGKEILNLCNEWLFVVFGMKLKMKSGSVFLIGCTISGRDVHPHGF
jgi:hypothetical protein